MWPIMSDMLEIKWNKSDFGKDPPPEVGKVWSSNHAIKGKTLDFNRQLSVIWGRPYDHAHFANWINGQSNVIANWAEKTIPGCAIVLYYNALFAGIPRTGNDTLDDRGYIWYNDV